MKRTSHSPILCVDDNEDDIFLFQLLLKRTGATASFKPVLSSQASLDWLQSLSGSTADHPFVCFLDIRMPQFSGFEILTHIRSQAVLARLPIVMGST